MTAFSIGGKHHLFGSFIDVTTIAVKRRSGMDWHHRFHRKLPPCCPCWDMSQHGAARFSVH